MTRSYTSSDAIHLSEAVKVVFCRPSERQPEDGVQRFSPVGESITDALVVSGMVRGMIERESTSANYPLIGHLTHLVFLNRHGNPLLMVNIVAYDNMITLDKCQRRGEEFEVRFSIPSYKEREARAVSLVKNVYLYMEQNMPTEVRRLDRYYSAKGLSLQRLLFDAKNSEGGQGQPAADGGRTGQPLD